jgi:2-polyprenyl-6-methoxyphenol hydroxylase-like FAD-dependent oxidoreductase
LYDLLVIGGGLGGASLGKAMAERGARVMIVEREREFRDRVRGEGMHPWGVVEAARLGILKLLLDSCGHPARWWNVYSGPRLVSRRDLVATTASTVGALNFYHPAMQQALLDGAAAAGAEVRRPAEVVEVRPGKPPAAVVRSHGREERLQARLLVAADGRTSRTRAQAGLPARRDPECLGVAGVLHAGLGLPEDTVQMLGNWSRGESVLIFPQGVARFRSYLLYRREGPLRPLAGACRAENFLAACRTTGAPAEWFVSAQTIGPLASFDAADRWVEHPYRAGIVLIGDAAAASDPCFGCGLSLTLRDVRVLRDQLLATADWDGAAHAYADDHDRYYGALRTVIGWRRELYFERGHEADARRARAFPRLAQEPERSPDLLGLGPDSPIDDVARRRFFGED